MVDSMTTCQGHRGDYELPFSEDVKQSDLLGKFQISQQRLRPTPTVVEVTSHAAKHRQYS